MGELKGVKDKVKSLERKKCAKILPWKEKNTSEESIKIH
jgi:hypothetical protein